MNPKEVLSLQYYRGYRNVRAAEVLFVALGGVLVLGGIGLEKPAPERAFPPAAAIGIALVGSAGVETVGVLTTFCHC